MCAKLAPNHMADGVFVPAEGAGPTDDADSDGEIAKPVAGADMSKAARFMIQRAQGQFSKLLRRRTERMEIEEAEAEKEARDPCSKCKPMIDDPPTKGMSDDERHELSEIFDIIAGEPDEPGGEPTIDTDEFNVFFDGLEEELGTSFKDRLWRYMGPEATDDGDIDRSEFLIGMEVAFKNFGSNAEEVSRTFYFVLIMTELSTHFDPNVVIIIVGPHHTHQSLREHSGWR